MDALDFSRGGEDGLRHIQTKQIRGIKMKKTMDIVLILAVFLVGGCLESGIEGKYVNTKHPEDYMEVNSDGTFLFIKKLEEAFLELMK